LLARAACEDAEEGEEVVVGREEPIVVEVDVVAGVAWAAGAAREHGEEVDEVSIFGEEGVLVEVEGVAGWAPN
jgi:hypothetical protein